jgi:hypothetical protein
MYLFNSVNIYKKINKTNKQIKNNGTNGTNLCIAHEIHMTKVNQAITKQYNFSHTLQHKDDKRHFRMEE